MKTLVFAGQGSQFACMGAGLFDRFPQLQAAADDIMGLSMAELCLEDAQGRLGLTQFAQPALYFVGALAWCAWQEDAREEPALVPGHDRAHGRLSALVPSRDLALAPDQA